MAAKALPCPTLLRQLLRYEPETGNLFWKERPVWMFSDAGFGGQDGCARRWNGRCAGHKAISSRKSGGYLSGTLFGNPISAHVAAWMIHYGVKPMVIDHINGDPSDNRLANLRSTTLSGNARNRKISRNNKSGHQGVVWRQATKKWLAQISDGDARTKHLGTFITFGEAVAARKSAERDLGFHENHGREALK